VSATCQNFDGRKALLVEDEPLVRWMERRAFESLGFFVTEAESCRLAQELWAARQYDLVVLDQRLMDGLGSDLLQRMRQAGHGEPVIYISAEADDLTPDLLASLQVHAVLAKPVETDLLRRVLTALYFDRAGVDQGPAGLAPAGAEPAARPLSPKPFVHVLFSGRVTRDKALRVAGQYAPAERIALNVQAVDELEADAVPVFIDMARRCREAGGCFCLVGISSDLRRRWARSGFTVEADVICGVEPLEKLSQRLGASAG
jgi:CheY-like chemotaxis protein/anti-anti-sigma regulatory factor